MADTLQGDFHLAVYQLEYSEGLIVNSKQTDGNKLNRHAKPGEVGEARVRSETRTNLGRVNNAPTMNANKKSSKHCNSTQSTQDFSTRTKTYVATQQLR